MIKASDAIRIARSLIGTPYSELDCINLIKKVIRTAPGGVEDYTTAGTNALWKSINSAKKYRDIIWRQEGISGACAGMLAFKRSGTDVHHVGIVTEKGTVIHSSSVYGKVVETALDGRWQLVATHRYIETEDGGGVPQEGNMESYRAIVTLKDPGSSLNVRNEPGRGGDVINRLFNGQSVTVQVEYENGWAFVQYGDSGMSGYVSLEYLTSDDTPVEAPGDEAEMPENVIHVSGIPVIVDGAGNEFFPIGGWHVEFRAADKND